MSENAEEGMTLRVFEIEHIYPFHCGEEEQHEQGGGYLHFEVPVP